MDDKNSLRTRVTFFATQEEQKNKFCSTGWKEEVTEMIIKRIIVKKSVYALYRFASTNIIFHFNDKGYDIMVQLPG